MPTSARAVLFTVVEGDRMHTDFAARATSAAFRGGFLARLARAHRRRCVHIDFRAANGSGSGGYTSVAGVSS